jgi:excisionase family DNA binding protein
MHVKAPAGSGGVSRRVWTVQETAEILGISVRSVWRLIAAGSIDTIRIGRCVRVVAVSLDALIARGGAK